MSVNSKKNSDSDTALTVMLASGQLAASGLRARKTRVISSPKNRHTTMPTTQLTSEAICLTSPLRHPMTSDPSKINSNIESISVMSVKPHGKGNTFFSMRNE